MSKPTDNLDRNDPGDEVIRRFRFQIGYSALKTITLIDPASIATCIYCEQFEDVLIELKDASFLGTQIKTRELDQPPLRTSDEAIHAALVRFCREDATFPGRFNTFCLATNHSFFGGDGAENLPLLVECARTNPALKGHSARSSFVKTIKKLASASKRTPEQVIATLAKLELEAMKTAIDLDLQIVQALSEIGSYAGLRYVQLLRAASLLRDRVMSASSKAHQFNQAAANAVTLDIAKRTHSLTIANKRLDASVVTECIQAAAVEIRTAAQERLTIRDYLPRDGAPAGLSTMAAKMSAGELTAMELEQYKDDVRSLEATFVRWKEKYDLDEANARLQHVEQLVIQQCRKHHDASKAPSGFSAPIITDRPALKSSLSALAEEEALTLYGCRVEHLAGAVGVLTDECRVWWSEPFDLQGTS